MISPLPGATPTVPGTATRPFPGIIIDIQTKTGESVGTNEGGYLVIKHPFPSMLRTIWGDDERYKKLTGRRFRMFISRATARDAMNAVIFGLWAELTT